MDFAHPQILYSLALIPLLWALYLLSRMARKRKIARFGKPSTLAPLMPEASKYKPAIKITLETLALAALIVALARPRGGEKEATEEVDGIEVMIAVDVSRSMLASSSDERGAVSRLNRAKFLLGRLINGLDNDKVGLIVFAGTSSTQMPLTTDFLSAKMYLDDINTDMIKMQGTDIGGAISLALNSFSPNPDINKAIVLITDCEDHENEGIAMAKKAHENGVQVDVIGVGTEKGAPIPLDAQSGNFLKDRDGRPVTTSFNPEVAKAIAQAGGGIYVDGSSSDAVSKIEECLDNIKKSNIGEVAYKSSAEKFPIFIWIALTLLIVDIFILDRKIGWLQKINFFTKTEK